MANVDQTKEKKQIPLRISKSLWTDLNRWAEEDFRSINGQIEYILTEAVKKRKKISIIDMVEDTIDESDTLDEMETMDDVVN